jgi:hypothetical protein
MPSLSRRATHISLATVLRINAERTVAVERYEEDGAFDRFAYVRDLADNYGVDLPTVIDIADLLGPDENFDGLVCTLEDGIEGYGFAAAVLAREA